MVELSTVVGIKGRDVFDVDGERIGKVEEIWVAGHTKQPEWISVGTGLFFGTGTRLVPIDGATFTEDGIRVPFTKDRVKGSPEVDTNQGILEDSAATRLCAYYDVTRGATSSGAGGPEHHEEVRRPGSMTSPAEEARVRRWIE